MKKLLKTGKKALSVFMAIMMLMTAWVWVAPTEAGAANGTYYLKVTYSCSQARLGTAESVSFDDNADNACIGIMYDYVTNNGRGTKVETATLYDMKDVVSKTGTKNDSPVLTLKGFPTKLYFILNDDWTWPWENTQWDIKKLELGSSSTNLETIWSGVISLKSTNQYKYLTYDVDGNITNSSNATIDNTDDTWVYPYVPSANETYFDVNKNVSDIGIPPLGDNKDVNKSTHSIQYYAYDNYGVRYEPTSYTVTGVSGLTTGTGWSCGSAYPITATSSTTESTVGVSQTATVTMNWNNGTSQSGQIANTTATFQVYNPRYKVTYDGNGGTLGTGYTYAYYGRAINHSTSTATTNNVAGLDAELFPTTGIKEGYTFDGMYTTATGGGEISATQTVSADVTYYAHWNINQYTATFYGTKANDAGTDTIEYIIDTSTVNYNNNPVPPSTVDGYSLGDYDYTFAGWDKEISPIGVNGAEYRATYTSTFVPADYDAVDDIVAEANDIINSENYEGIYSEESRNALEAAVNSVNYNFGRTNQETVDGYVPLIRAAIDGLGRQKYSVLFIDAVDNSVIELRYPVYYGDAITMPEAPVRGFTSTDHYVFREWTTSEDGDNINFVEKNMIILANYDKVAHTYTDTDLPSNCTTQAGVKHTCSCGYEYVEYSGSVGTEHNLETEWTVDIAPTCTTVGSKSYHCTRCSYRDSVTEIPALDHDYTDGYQGVVIAPGCENDGAEVSECQRCGYDKYSLLPAVGHAWTENVIAPTCTSSGYTVKTCSNCYDEDIVSFVDPVAHTYTEATDEYVAPTCTGLGKRVSYCSCGAQKVETVEATGHAWNTELTTDYEATCTTKGQQSIHCSVCDVINGESITEIPENGHTWGEESCEQKESCGIKGLYVKTCEVCQVNSSRWVDALTHNYETTTTPATCTEAGSSVDTCKNCGDIKNPTVIQPIGHKYENTGAIEDVAATCTTPAYKKYKCDVCGDTRVEYIEGSTALLHDFTGTETIVSDATCETDGKKTVKCSRCDATTTVVIPKLGHSYGDWVKTDATNDTDGSWYHKCSTCGKEETLTIPKGGHNFVEDTSEYVAPKCNAKGQRVYKCDAHENCIATVTVELDYAQHTVTQKVTNATCTTPGSVKAYCSVCDANCEKPFSTTETPVVPHTFDNGTATDATCTTSGYITYTCTTDGCGFSYKEYDASKPALGHNYKDEVTTSATCTTDGEMTYTCQNDASHTYTEKIPATGHTYDAGTIVQAQSCTKAEKTEYKCGCGASYIAITKEAKEHTFGSWTLVQEATTDSYGIEKRECSDCDAVEYKTTAPTGAHDFEKISETPASCTKEGSIVWECKTHTDCEADYTETLDKLPHTQKIEYTAPTCTAAGSTQIVCEVCSAELSELQTIPAKGHSYNTVNVTKEATCTDTGVRTYSCACGDSYTETIPAKGHDLSTTVTDATCGEEGKVVTTCSRCDYSKTTVLTAKNHAWNDGEETKAPTCEDTGTKTYSCTVENCTATKTEDIPATGHTWGGWTVTPSTNDAKGSVSRKCTVDGCNETETVEIPAGGHELTETARENSTCTTEGSVTYTCQVAHTSGACGISVTVKLPVAQHTIAKDNKEATCTEAGYSKTYCSVCKEEFNSVEIPVKAHEYVAQTAVAPTCTSSGYTPYKCACGDTYNEYDETKPATPHALVEGASTANCTNGGKMTLTCENCTYSTTVKVAALGHNYVEDTSAATEATCAVPATKTYECSRCTASYTVYDDEKSTEHTWGSWVVKEAATATSLGYQTAECSVCGQIKVETIPATGEHNYSIETSRTPATCTADGSVTYKCSTHTDCGLTSTVTLPATGHTETLEYNAATCEGKGSTKLVCSVVGCEQVIDSKEIPALGHLYGDGTVTNATCKDEGKIEYTCTRTDCTNKTKTVEIPTNANAHKYATVVTDSTCTTKGSVVTACTLCGDKTTEKELPLIEHTWDSGVETKKATCTTDGLTTCKCKTTGCTAEKTETIAKLGHDWNDWVKVDATNDTDGSWTRTCKNDANHVETVVIPKGDHKLVVDIDNSTYPTCTAKGKTVYKCDNHADCGVAVEVETDKLQHVLAISYDEKATCTTEGKVVTSCTSCKTELITTIIPATGHDYSGTVTQAPTCTAEGTMTYTCAHDANHTYTEPIAKLQHNYVAGTPVAATCTSNGYTPYKCATCESNYVIITAPAKTHSYTEKVSSTATCTNEGVMTLGCACGATMETNVPALGHNYELKSSTTATCAAAATETYKCSRCTSSYTISVGAKTENHTWGGWVIKENATASSLGYQTAECTVCGQLKVETIPSTGEHNFNDETARTAATCTTDGSVTYKCSTHTDCGLTSTVTLPATGHTEALEYTPATCTKEGSTKLVCSVESCKEVLKEETIPALGHTWGNGNVTPATCNTEGEITYTCTNCNNATEKVTIPVDSEAHKLKVTTTLSTCGKEGSVVVTCENGCNAKNETTTIPMLAHNWGTWTVDTAATNTADGKLKRVCANDASHVEYATIPAGGHSFNTDAPASTTTAANCKEQGTATYNCTAHNNCGVTITVKTTYGEHSYKTDVVESCSSAGSVKTYCTVCDKVVADIALGMAQHEYEELSTTEATCTSSGYTTYKCKNCTSTYSEIGAAPVGHTIVKSASKADCITGDTIVISCEKCSFKQEVDVPALGHDYKLNGTTDATCAAAATETYKCSRCEASYTISVGDKTTAHDWNDWEVVEEATYTSLGYKIRTCKVCGKLEVETIPATGDHVFDKLKSETDPTCETAGEKIYACSKHTDCGLTSIVTVPATGHDEIVTTVAATCEGAGSTTTTCSKCDYKAVEAIPALGHIYGEGVVTAATCKKEGSIVYTCTRQDCGATHTTVIDIDANAHNLKVDVAQAGCLTAGSVTVTCNNSGCDYKDETAIPAKGHTFTGTETVISDATCTADGEKTVKCANCTEKKTETIAKLGHNMEAGTAVAPTCTSSGYTPYTCKNTDCTHSYNVYDEDQPANGHTWSDWAIVNNATQDTEGLKRRSCTVCNDATEEQTIPAMKHEMTVAENVAATCKAPGHITYECKIAHDGVTCGYTLVVDLPAVPHTLSTTVNEATCTATGSVVTSCGCGYSETTTLDIAPHKEILSIIPADCENVGYAVTNCAVCKGEIQRQEISALGHDFDESIEANVKVTATATCAKEGSKEVKCSRCDEVKTVVIAKPGHDFEVIETHTATCTESGYIVKDCKNCDEAYSEFVSDPTGHKWNGGVETAPATCTANGVKTYTCQNDASHTYTQTLAKLGHDWGNWEVTLNPTGTVDGIQSRKCKTCGATENATIPALGGTTTYKVTFVVDGKTVATQTVNHNGKATAPIISNKAPDASNHYSYIWDTDFSRVTSDLTVTAIFTPAAHTFGAWITDITPDCNNEGRRYRVCIADGCGYAQYEAIEKTDHSIVVIEVGKPATCTENGYEKVKCENCGLTEERVLKRLGHLFTYHEAVDPTCDTDGLAGHYSCSRCGKNYKDRAGKTEIANVVVSKTYHTFIVVEGSEATCTSEGKTDYMYCTTCGYTRNPEPIPATGHADGNNDNTCDKCGSTYMENNAIVCSCSCHKNGFFNELIYKILSFFWRLFGSNKSCECGKVHY